jgi:tetratricopeptide (TPR) repeat protein
MNKRQLLLEPNRQSTLRSDRDRVTERRNVARTRVLNVRLLMVTIAVVGILGPSLYGLHRWQFYRNAETLFQRAQQLERDGNHGEAAATAFQYLNLRPDDPDARVFVAQTYDKTANKPTTKERAVELYQVAVGRFEDRHDLRARMAELLLELNRLDEAERECLRLIAMATGGNLSALSFEHQDLQTADDVQRLIGRCPQAPSALRTLANAKYRQFLQGQHVSGELLIQCARNALLANTDNLELMLVLAESCRANKNISDYNKQTALADEELTSLISSHPDRAKASLALHGYRVRHHVPNPEEPLQEALQAAPNDYDVHLAMARHSVRVGQLSRGEEFFERAIGITPARSDAHVGLAELSLHQGNSARAIELCREAGKHLGEHNLDVNLVLVQSLIIADRLAEVEPILSSINRRLEEISPSLDRADRIVLNERVIVLDADYRAATGKWNEAVQLVRPLAMSRTAERTLDQDESSRADRWRRLGEWYAKLESWDLSARAHEQQAQLAPENCGAHLASASAWLNGQRPDRASEHLKRAVELSPTEPQAWIRLARLEMQRQLQLHIQDWSAFDHALLQAKQLDGQAIDVERLQIQALLAKGSKEEAERRLELALASHPDEHSRFAIAVFQSLGKSERAAACLEQLKVQSSRLPAELAETEADYYIALKDHERGMLALRSAISNSAKSERYRLQKRLALVALEIEHQSANPLLLALAKEYPHDPWPLVQLAEQSLTKNELAALTGYAGQLMRVEGQGGTFWRFYRGMAATLTDDQKTQTTLREARRMHAELESLRPAWSATHQLRGQIARHEGRLEEAADAYREAIDTGARNLSVFEGLITLLYGHYQWAEADEYLVRLREAGYSSKVLESYSPRVLMKAGDYDQAVRAARTGVRIRTNDAMAHLWLGQTLTIAAERAEQEKPNLVKEAEQAFQEAARLSPDDYRVWAGTSWFYLRTGRHEDAKAAVKCLEDRARLTDVQRALALGQAYHLLGESTVAERHFLNAVTLLPNDPAVYEKLAEFYLTQSPRKAEEAYRKLLTLDPRSLSTRRSLATLLAARGAPESLNEAIKILADGHANEANRRLRVLLLLQHGGRDQILQAKRLLQMDGNLQTAVGDRLLCALVCEALGEITEAYGHLRYIVDGKQTAEYLGILADFELRNDLLDKAEASTAALLQIDSQNVRSIGLRARWLKSSGKADSIIADEIARWKDVADAQVSNASERDRLAIVCAHLLGQLGMQEHAERAYRDLLKNSSRVDGRRAFALWLANQGRIKEAVSLAYEAVKSSKRSSASMQLLGSLLTIGASRGFQFEVEEELLHSSAMEARGDATLLLELATLRHMQGRSEEAKSLYLAALRVAPNHVLIYNNLAVVLAEQTDTLSDALIHIEKALSLAGPQAELQDTHATILGNLGRHEEARQILRSLIARSPGNSRYRFHLAQIEYQANNIDAAIAELAIAHKHRLGDQLLTPYERSLLSELVKLKSTAATKSADRTQSTAIRTAR